MKLCKDCFKHYSPLAPKDIPVMQTRRGYTWHIPFERWPSGQMIANCNVRYVLVGDPQPANAGPNAGGNSGGES